MSFTDAVYTLSPSWWRGWAGSRFLYSIAVQLDALTDLAAYAVRARFPSLAPPDADPYLSLDRGIDRGYQETRLSWLARCREWLERWAHCGSPWGVLMAVRGVISPSLSAVTVVTPRGTWDSYADGVQDGIGVAPSHQGPGVQGFDWCSVSWPYPLPHGVLGRAVVVVWPDPDTGWSRGTRTWGDGSTWDDGGLWDVDGGTAAEFRSLLSAVATWKSGGTWVPAIVLSWSSADFSLGGGGAQPDGHYGTWSKLVTSGGRTTRVPSRYAGAAYCAGVI